MRSKWRANGVEAGDMIRLDNGDFEGRLGHGWARGRLKHGDVLIALEHGGDCFFHYQLVDASKVIVDGVETLRLEPVGRPIGAYTLGRPIGNVGAEVLEMIEGGAEDVSIPVPDLYDTPQSTEESETFVDTLGDLFQQLRTLSPKMLETKISLLNDSGRTSPGAWVDVNHKTGTAWLRDSD
jgi:hypothetical protein